MDIIAHLQSNVWPLLEQVYGLPQGVLNAIAGYETGGTYNTRAFNAESKAAGLFQLTPVALKQLAIDTGINFDPYSPGAASAAAALLLRRQLRIFRGDISLAIAGYNAGEGRVRRYLAQVQAEGKGSLPLETARYIKRIREAL